MEVKLSRYKITYNGGVVIVSAKSMEDAIDRFKELRIETCTKDIVVSNERDSYLSYLKSKNSTL